MEEIHVLGEFTDFEHAPHRGGLFSGILTWKPRPHLALSFWPWSYSLGPLSTQVFFGDSGSICTHLSWCGFWKLLVLLTKPFATLCWLFAHINNGAQNNDFRVLYWSVIWPCPSFKAFSLVSSLKGMTVCPLEWTWLLPLQFILISLHWSTCKRSFHIKMWICICSPRCYHDPS